MAMRKRKKQRIISFIVTVFMMVTMMSGMTTTVNAVTIIDVSNYTELTNAISSAAAGDTINITNDITISAEVGINKSLIIDGNNHTIKVPVPGLDDSGIYNTNPSNFRVFNVSASGKTVEIKNLTVKGGSTTSAGAGILNNSGTVLKLTNINVSNSRVAGFDGGGGIANIQGTVYIKNSNISRNAAGYGGGFFNYLSGSKMFIENCTFSENRSTAGIGGGGAGENKEQGQLYVNNSTFSNNRSTEFGGAVNNNGGTAYFVNSTFTGNVVYGDYKGAAIANSGGTVTALNTLFAYNYRNSGSLDNPAYTLSDVEAYQNSSKINAYYCVFHAAIDTALINNITGNTQYNGAEDGSNNSLFSNGISSKVIGEDGLAVGINTIFQPLLAKASGINTPTALLGAGSFALLKGVKTSFTNGNGTPTIGYYNGSTWVTILGSAPQNYEVTTDQNNVARTETPTVGALETTYPIKYMLKVNTALGGTVHGGPIYGDAYNLGDTITLTAIPNDGYRFVRWDYVDGGNGTASTSNPYTVTVTGNITLKPVFSPPTITSGEVNRISDTEATVQFTSTDSGQYYYKIVDHGAGAPTIDTTIAGIPCSAGKITITNPTGLTAGAKDIYIVVKDGEGNESAPKEIDIQDTQLILTQGDVTRTSDAEATIKFTSNKNIQYSYEIDTMEGPLFFGPLDVNAGEIIINLIGLTPGPYMIMLQANALSGSGGDMLMIEIPPYVPDTTPPADATFTADVTSPINGDVKVTINYPSDAKVLQYSLDGDTYSNYTGAITFNNDGALYAKSQDAAGNWSNISQYDVTNIDKTSPNTAVIANKDKYTENNWFNETQTITASFTKTEGCSEKLQYKTDDSAWTDGESVDVSAEGKHIVSFRVIDALGRSSEEQTVNVNIDNTAPTNAKITVKDKEFTSFLNTIAFGLFFKETVGVTISADCDIAGLGKIGYQKVSDAASYDPNGTWTNGDSFSISPDEKFIVYAKIIDNAGNFVIINSDGVIVDATQPALTLTPDANNWTKNNVSVKVKVSDNLAGIKEVRYTTDEAEPQTGTAVISGGEGTITLANEGQYKLTVTAKDNSLNEISESTNIKIDRTKPEISGVNNSSSYYIGRIIKITDDLGEIAEAAYKNGTDTETSFTDGALFEKPGAYTLKVTDKAGNSSELSFEIKSLPALTDVVYTPECKALIDSIRAEFTSHNDLPEPYKTDMNNKIKALEDRYTLKQLMLHDDNTDTTVLGIEGTSFTSDVYLVVTPIIKDTSAADFNSAFNNVENAAKYISAIKGKELLALYDVSLLKDGIKIQPDGKVKVKIRIPEEFKNRTGFDIVHIADNGTITSMNAVIEGEYLVFITDHFSDYAIVAKTITNVIPKTGGVFDFNVLSIIGVISILGGILVLALRRKKVQ
jgi:LPXTG-motif cell wall-anchored protein